MPPDFPLIEGDSVQPAKYVPPDEEAGYDTTEKHQALVDADGQLLPFEGMINGFRLYSLKHSFEDPSVGKKTCVVQEFPPADAFTISYLPSGTRARGPQFSGTCSDGSLSFTMRMFETRQGRLDVIYQPNERALGHDASEGRVTQAVIQGLDAVAIVPLLENGFGRTWVAFPTENGFVTVDGDDLPLTEALKVAEGVKCVNC